MDQVRYLGWQGVLGNTDEMLFDPASLSQFASQSPAMKPFLAATEEMATWTRGALEEQRLVWLRGLPRVQKHGALALVRATPASTWQSPGAGAAAEELMAAYGSLGRAFQVWAHPSPPTFEAWKQ